MGLKDSEKKDADFKVFLCKRRRGCSWTMSSARERISFHNMRARSNTSRNNLVWKGNLTMWAEDGTTQVLFRSRSKARREGHVLRMSLY